MPLRRFYVFEHRPSLNSVRDDVFPCDQIFLSPDSSVIVDNLRMTTTNYILGLYGLSLSVMDMNSGGE